MMSAYDLFECFEFFIYGKIFLKQWLEQKKIRYPPKSHICYPKTKACIDMKNNRMQRKVNYPRIFYSGLEYNPLKSFHLPSRVATVRIGVFHDASTHGRRFNRC